MYDFAVIALMALAVVKVVDFLADSAEAFHRFRPIITFLLGIGAMWQLDYSVFEEWGVQARNHATGVWMTGFMVCGATVAWRAVFAYLTHDRAEADETLGQHNHLRSAA
jgi:hypothetical protein